MIPQSHPIRIELPTGMTFGPVNAYLFIQPEPVLIDTGLKTTQSWTVLKTALARYGLTAADLRRIVITHPHVDHCGLALQLAQISGANIWIADLGQPWLVDLPGHLRQRLDYYKNYYFPRWDFTTETNRTILSTLAQIATVCEAVPPSLIQTFNAGDTIELGGLPWQILHTPGHAYAQTCFYQANTRQLLAADMLLAKAPAPVLERPQENSPANQPALSQFFDSLTMVEKLDIQRVYPGHGEPFSEHRQVIQLQRERLNLRLNQCAALITAGHNTVAALMTQMYPTQSPQFNLAGLWMLIAYLDFLETNGIIKSTTAPNGVCHYQKQERN